jgi:hypothetical protein
MRLVEPGDHLAVDRDDDRERGVAAGVEQRFIKRRTGV